MVFEEYHDIGPARFKISTQSEAKAMTGCISLIMLTWIVRLGADTPVYLATLPKGVTEPYGQFISERQVVNVDKECPL